MTEQEKFNCYCKKYGYNNKTFFNRPHWTRRRFFQLAGAGVTGTFLAQKYAKAQSVVTNPGLPFWLPLAVMIHPASNF